MKNAIPRIVIAGTNSGCGKTTVSCAILQALANRGLKVGAFKCGPDYIDTMYHSEIIKAVNLDSFFFSENTLKYLLAENGAECDISIIEGVMGFYDGMSMSEPKASTYEISQITESPVVLVIGAKGAALSILATIHGFLNFYPDNRICGVILNQCTEMTYKMIYPQIMSRFDGKVIPLGYLPKLSDGVFKSRHLGLVTAAEIDNVKENMQKLGEYAEKYIDIDKINELASGASKISYEPVVLPRFSESVRIAVAKDKAFCFYYEDNLRALTKMGAELVWFSPLEEKELPSNVDGIYLGGGYPELYAKKLSENKFMLNSLKNALYKGIPCIAECGGFMYLTESIGDYPMVGYLSGKCFDNRKLTRFGYVKLKAKKDMMLCSAGEEIAAHEFHYWDSEDTGRDFVASKMSGRTWDCVFANDRLYAGYPHFHFYANIDFAINFYKTCLKEKHSNDSEN